MSISPQPLDYPTRAAWPRRRWAYRAIMLGAALVAIIAGMSVYRRIRPIIDRNLAMADLYQRAMAYKFPKDQLAYQDRLPRDSGEMVMWSTTPFAARLAPNASDARGTAFSHSRRAPGGAVRLVGVEINPHRARRGTGFSPGPIPEEFLWMIQVRVIRPASLFSEGGEIWTQQLPSVGEITCADWLQVAGGQIDPADESHFTIGINGRIIDGWLRADDTVTLSLRLEIE